MSFDRSVRVGFFAVLLLIFAYLLVMIARPFLSYLLAALLLAFMLYPVQQRLEPRVGPKVAALLLVSLAVGLVTAVVALLVISIPADAEDLSGAVEQIPGEDELEGDIQQLLGVEVDIGGALEAAPQRVGDLLVGDLTSLVAATTDLFLGLVLFLFVLYYLLQDGRALVEWVKRMLPLERETTDDLAEEAYETTWAVLESHVLIAFVQGLVSGIGLFVVGIPHVVFWTIVMMVAELFPVVGVALVLGPAVVYLVAVDQLLAAAFLTIYGLTAVALVDDYLRALIVDRESSLHSAAILVGVFGGVYAFGFMGLFYGPILIGLFQELVVLFNERFLADDLETATAQSPTVDAGGEGAGSSETDGQPGADPAE